MIVNVLRLPFNIYVNNELLGNNKYVFITTDENEEHSADKTNWEHQNS